jgi:transcriptional regulator with XRE-family HTH domain
MKSAYVQSSGEVSRRSTALLLFLVLTPPKSAVLLTLSQHTGRLASMPQSLTANQVVAYNLSRIRKTLGLSQEEAAKRLEPYLPGKRWSKAVYSAAERSYHGNRIRQFTADDLVGMSLAFGVPIAYFFLPPRPEDRKEDAVLRSGDTAVRWRDLFEVMVGGQYRASLYHRMLELPPDERPVANSDDHRAVRQVGLSPPEGPLSRWVSDAGEQE